MLKGVHMEPINIMDINRAADEMLQLYVRHHRRKAQRQWGTVRPAAISLLNFADSPFVSNRRGLAQRKKQLREVLGFSTVGAAVVPVVAPVDRVVLSDHDLKQIHTWTRKMLASLVLNYRPDAPPGAASFETPPCKVLASYFRGRPDLLFCTVEVKPRYMHLILASGEVLRAAMPWIRFCEVCLRLFFKVKRQRFCGRQRCKQVFHGRNRHERKTDSAERRGRPRINYAAPTLIEYEAWLRMAYERSRRQRLV